MRPTITLYDNPRLSDDVLADWTSAARGWKHVVRDMGGYWTADIPSLWTGRSDSLFSYEACLELWNNGLGRRVVASLSDVIAWEGMVHDLVWTLDGRRYRRSLESLKNSMKLVYSRMGANLVVNGSAELGATGWHKVHSLYHPAWFGIVTISTDWSSSGPHSFWIDNTDVEEGEEGCGVSLDGTGSVYAGRTYKIRAVANCIHNEYPTQRWWFEIIGGGDLLFTYEMPQGTEGVYNVDFDWTNPADGYDGAVSIAIRGEAPQTAYFDAVVMYENGTRAETGLYMDADSIARYGTKDGTQLLGGMGDAEAIARALRDIAWCAWPRTQAEDLRSDVRARDGLSVGLRGYAHTLAWNPVTVGGYKAASTHIIDLLALSDFVLAGDIQSNALESYVEEQEPERSWDSIEKVIQAGDDTGARWSGGVYAGRHFDYGLSDTEPRYIRLGGVWLDLNHCPVEPCRARTGLYRDDDMPQGPYSGIDPRLIYVDEIEYDRDLDTFMPRTSAGARDRLGLKPAYHDAAAVATIGLSRSF